MRPWTVSALMTLLALCGCSAVRSVRWPWASGHGTSPPPPAGSTPRNAPGEPAPPPPSDLGPVVPAPPQDGLPPTTLSPESQEPPESPGPPENPGPPASPPSAALPPMPGGPRVPWSGASDPELSSLPAGVGVAAARPWTVVVLHHSATKRGSTALFDKAHRAKGEEGVGYHFVIGNGTDTGDGEIEVTFRWRDQKDGSHAKGWDELSIGVCLVGNYEDAAPTPAQRDALVRLLRHLRRRFGIPAERVVAHKALNPTACPGKRFPMSEVLSASAP